jgi:hypothetical protein
MNSTAFEAFLASQQAGFESFLTQCEDVSLDDINRMLSKHYMELQRILGSKHPLLGETKATSIPATPHINARQLRAIPTHTPAGRPLSVAGAGTLFKTGSGSKRRGPPSDSDSSLEAAEVNTIRNNASPVPRTSKRRLASASKVKNSTNKDADNQDLEDESKPSNGEALATSAPKAPVRRRGSGQKRVLKNPFISN